MEKPEDLIDYNKYQVFIFCCPAYIPFNLFRHPWIALNNKGVVSRWEIRNFINKKDSSYLFINNQPPFEGINKTIFLDIKWQSQLLCSWEGDKAKSVIDFVSNSKNTYPYINKYFFKGPNSNTYIQWILNKFPEIDLKLNWRFIGKDYKLR